MMTEYIKMLLSPVAGDSGGGGSGDPPADPPDDPPDGDDPPDADDPPDDPPAPPEPKPKTKASKKVQVSVDRLKDLEDKAKKHEEREKKDREAADAVARDKLKKQTEADPRAALTTLQRKYTTDTNKLKAEIEETARERDTLRIERATAIMNERISESLVEALKAAKLEPVSDKAGPRMVAEIAARLDIERQPDGSYEIFGKDDAADMGAVIRDLIKDEFKDLYLKSRRSEPAASGNSTRRPPADPEKPANGDRLNWSQAFAERKKLYETENGYVPSTGFKPKASGK